ncbi:hypothetical protein TCAL_14388 [Tigriopus californicus]|uniref:Protein sleepless n=1 Tax=Tigriopus californicus TaxID=6832 RepID=A0A553PJG3_TIGCA|nr:hypothetical protein TCAL_14388 [Tigriopus californicus]
MLQITVSALKCFVGSGNSSDILPATPEDYKAHEMDNSQHEFKIMTCGTANSELVSFDRLVSNVTSQIQSKLGGLADKAANALSGSRKKREDSDYACAKIRMGGTSHRSCVSKISDIKLNCTSAVGQLALCYCHEDHCNSASRPTGLWMASTVVLFAAVVTFGKMQE